MSTNIQFFVGFVLINSTETKPCIHSLQTGNSYTFSNLKKLPTYGGHLLGKNFRKNVTYDAPISPKGETFKTLSQEEIREFEALMDKY